jgi:uncharacterized protein YndB with AHSA1/START domain
MEEEMSAAREQAAQGRVGEDYRHRFEFAAPIDAVYGAIATPEGVRGWWTPNADVATEVGEIGRLHFGKSGWTDLRIERLEAPHRVEWACVAQSIANFQPDDEWVGTTISFELGETDGGTRLDFTHHGLAPLGCIELCETGWQLHIGQSLKALVEKGV